MNIDIGRESIPVTVWNVFCTVVCIVGIVMLVVIALPFVVVGGTVLLMGYIFMGLVSG